MSPLLIIIILLLLFGGGLGSYRAYQANGPAWGGGSVIGLILIVLLILYLFDGPAYRGL